MGAKAQAMAKGVTIPDAAKALGVETSTVARIVQDHPDLIVEMQRGRPLVDPTRVAARGFHAVTLSPRGFGGGDDGPLAYLPATVVRLYRSGSIKSEHCMALAQFLFDVRMRSGLGASPGLSSLVAYGTTIQVSCAGGDAATPYSYTSCSRLLFAQNRLSDDQHRVLEWVAMKGRSLSDYAKDFFPGRTRVGKDQARDLLLAALSVLAESYGY